MKLRRWWAQCAIVEKPHLGVAVDGVAVLGVAVLGVALLHVTKGRSIIG